MMSLRSPSRLFPALLLLLQTLSVAAQSVRYVVTDATLRPSIQAYLAKMRAGILDLNKPEDDIWSWDTSDVTNMARLFEGASDFQADISGWDTARVTTMRRMFKDCPAFNAPLGQGQINGGWNTASVEDMSDMFHGATTFAQDLNAWDTSAATNMARMFQGAMLFQGNVDAWDTSKVEDMTSMFQVCTYFILLLLLLCCKSCLERLH